MFGSLVGSIGKIFTSVAGGVAKLGSAVRAVGASLFTGMAATGGGLTSGLLNGVGGTGILGNILSGALKTGLTGALLGAAVGAATGQGWEKGALIGGLGGAAAGGLGGAFAPTGIGVDPTTTGAISAAATPTGAVPNLGPIPDNMFSVAAGGTAPGAAPKGFGASLGFGEGGFFRSEGGAGMLAGLGAAAGDVYAAKAAEESAQADRDAVRAQEKRRTNSYKIDPNALVGGGGYTPDTTVRPTPATAWAYNPSTGMIERGGGTAVA